MAPKVDYLAPFAARARTPCLVLPDLTLWYDWHLEQGTLPDQWQGFSLSQIASAMGVPTWQPVKPWRVTTPGVEVVTEESEGQRTVRARTSRGTLVSRWTIGPDGDWWQTEYPVKSAADLTGALELAQARRYELAPDEAQQAGQLAGSEGILALEIPRRPFSDLLHQFLGWGEGLLLLADPAINDILAALEDQLQQLVAQLVG